MLDGDGSQGIELPSNGWNKQRGNKNIYLCLYSICILKSYTFRCSQNIYNI